MRRILIFIAAGLAIAAFAVSAVLVLSDDGAAAGPPLDGCREVETQELYVQHAYACQDGSDVLVFATDQARDDYLKVAEYFGTATIDRGVRWARVHR